MEAKKISEWVNPSHSRGGISPLKSKDAMAEYNTTYKAIAASSKLVDVIHHADSVAASYSSSSKSSYISLPPYL
jgi:hypothetical protein